MSIPIIQGNLGGLDKDADQLLVNNGDYLDAKNIRSVTNNGQTSGDQEIILGNEYADSIGSVVAQDKKYNIDGVSAPGTSTGWQYVGPDTITTPYNSATASSISGQGLAIDSLGVPYVAYIDASMGNRISVVYWNGVNWLPLGGVYGITSDAGRQPVLCIDLLNNVYFSYIDTMGGAVPNGGVTVYKWNGAVWAIVGTQAFVAPTLTGPLIELVMDTDDVNTPWVYYTITPSIFGGVGPTSVVQTFNGFTWNLVGTIGVNPTYAQLAQNPCIAFNSTGVPHVVFYSVDNNALNSYMWNGTNWVSLGNVATITATGLVSTFTSIAFNNLDVLYVSYINTALYVQVRNLVAGVWTNVGVANASPSIATTTAIGFDAASSLPFVSFADVISVVGTNPIIKRITVINFDGTLWNIYGTRGFSDPTLIPNPFGIVGISYTSIALFGGIPYVAYNNMSPIGAVSVQMYVGGIGTGPFKLTFKLPNQSIIGQTGDFYSASDALTEILLIFPATDFIVTQIASISSFTLQITTIDNNSLAQILGFDYTVESTGTYPLTITLLQESYDIGMSGEMQVIGSKDSLGDLFSFVTSNELDKEDVNSTAIPVGYIYSSSPSLPVTVTTNVPHNFITGQYVSIFNVIGIDSANGVSLINVTSTQSFVLLGVYSSNNYISGGVIKTFIQGVGEIGVHTKNNDTNQWYYTKLLRSREFDFSTKHPIDVDIERDSLKVSIYFTDFYNPIRSFYYKGPYINNGALAINSNVNKYVYGAINSTLLLQKGSPFVNISYGGQVNGSGALRCGNYRYSVKMTTSNGAETDWSILSNEFLVYPTTVLNGNLIYGGKDTDIAPKSNIINVSWNNNSIFKYIEFAYVLTLNSITIESKSFGKTLLQSGQSNIVKIHNGQESDVNENFDAGLLLAPQFIFNSCRNIRIIDNKLVISNIKLKTPSKELADWFAQFTYLLVKKELDGIGATQLYTTNTVLISKIGEYQDPDNGFNYVGYMQNETYRYFARAELYDGTTTEPYFLFDVKFDCESTSADGRRTGGLANFDINNTGVDAYEDPRVYVPYLRVNIPSGSFTVDNQDVKTVVRRVHIYRVEVSTRTVVMTGIGVLGTRPIGGTVYYSENLSPLPTYGNMGYILPKSLNTGTGFYDGALAGAYPSFLGEGTTTSWAGSVNTSVFYPGHSTIPGKYTIPNADRKTISFYSPDDFYGLNTINYNNPNKIINYGACSIIQKYRKIGSLYYNGQIVTPQVELLDNNMIPSPVQSCLSGGTILLNDGTNPIIEFSKTLQIINSGELYAQPHGYIFTVDTDLTNITALDDKAVYYMSYYNPLTPTQQYGNYTENQTVPTGAFYDLTTGETQFGIGVANEINVFGGDTVTSKNFLKIRFAVDPGAPTTNDFAQGIEYYTQSLINPQMRYNPDLVNNTLYPNDTYDNADPEQRVKEWLNTKGAELRGYNHGYDFINKLSLIGAYDPNAENPSILPASIFYSGTKAQGSLVDSYSSFLALNRKDLDLTFGAITHHENLNGELVTLQPRKFMRQYFNSTGILTTTDGSEVVMGDGEVLKRKGQTISTFGSTHKWSAIKGKTPGGDDVLYWVDIESTSIMRFGRDGTIPISSRANISSFTKNNLRWVRGKDIPTTGTGISSVWNEYFKEAIWTMRGHNLTGVDQWLSDEIYIVGEVVAFVPAVFTTFNQTGEFYTCVEDTAVGESPNTNPDKWVVIAHSNKDYYNEYTIVWSEIKNRFICFLTPIPKIYMQWGTGFLTPRPVSPQNKVYEHNRGEYTTWYKNGSDELTEDAYITSVFNYQPDIIKTAEAIRTDTAIVPYRVEVYGSTTKTYSDAINFAFNEDIYETTVMNDITSTGNPFGDTSRIYGKAIVTKFIFQSKVYQKLRNIILKVRVRNRLFNK